MVDTLDTIMDVPMYREALKALYKAYDHLPKKRGEGFHLHHKVPRFWFKGNKLDVDNSAENLVSLPIEKHILAHYLLWKGAAKQWKGLSGLAFQFLVSKCKVKHIGDAFDFAFEEASQLKHLSYAEIFGVERGCDLAKTKFAYMTPEMRKENGRKSSATKMLDPVIYECVETGERHNLPEWCELLGVKSKSSITNSDVYGNLCRGKHFKKVQQ